MVEIKEEGLNGFPNTKWRDFIVEARKFDEIEVSKWQKKHLLGYFMWRFEQAFGKEYQLKYNTSAPSKSYELFRLNATGSKISNDPKILKEYLDWIFDQRVSKDGKKFRSISFLVAEDNINWYRDNILFIDQNNIKIDRSTKLPDNIAIASGCNSYGDLAFLIKANINSDISDKLKDIGFDFGILDRIV